MILIYSTASTVRLQYICRFIFAEIFHSSYSLTTDADGFRSHDGIKINYSSESIPASFHLFPHGLLFEKNIAEQQTGCFPVNDHPAFFPSAKGDHPFDIFAAVFFLITRYEEYLSHKKDEYGRYAHTNSIAFREHFLNIPLVNIWLQHFAKDLHAYFPDLFTVRLASFQFQPTYDIDIAWSFKEKGILRNIGGFLRSPSLSRVKTLAGISPDPFDSYRFLDDLHTLNDLRPIYFFLAAARRSTYDKNISPANTRMRSLINSHAGKYEIGLHPSLQTKNDLNVLAGEKENLESIIGREVTKSRQHYISMNLPATYRELIASGISDDYSMGYGSINGFRASVANVFTWYDLEEDKISSLRIHPFCFMDANCLYEEKLSIEDSYNELMHYFLICKKYHGTFISIFHNNFFGTDKQFHGWKEIYQKFIAQVQ